MTGRTSRAKTGAPITSTSPRRTDEREEQRRHQEVGDDGAGGPGTHVEQAPDPLHVRGPDAGHLSGVHVTGQVAAEIARLACHQLLHPDGGGEEVGDGTTVTQHTGHGLHGAESQHHGGPCPQLGPVPAGHGVDGGTEGGRDEALGAHPDSPEDAAADDGGDLSARQPDEEAHRRAGVGFTGIGEREAIEQSRSAYATRLVASGQRRPRSSSSSVPVTE